MAYLAAGFNTVRIGTMACKVTDAGGNGTATVTAGKWCHRDLTSLSAKLGSGNYGDLATELKARIDALPTTAMDALTIDLSTGAYTLDFALETTVDFTTATLGDNSGLRLAEALGFDYTHENATFISESDPYNIYLSGAAIYTSNVTPYYYLALAKDGITHTDGWPPYQVAGQSRGVITTLGNGYGRSPTTKIYLCEVQFGVLAQAATFAQNASATVPWTYEDLVTHAGLWEPICIATTGLNCVIKDRVGDFGMKERESLWGSYHANWNTTMAALFIGYL